MQAIALARNKRLGLAILIVLLAVGLLYPLETTVVPEWRARVVDEAGNPLTGVQVSEQWQHYSIETEGHEAESRTDDNGYVVFPRRAISANLHESSRSSEKRSRYRCSREFWHFRVFDRIDRLRAY